MMMNLPKISIITVVFNSEKLIEQTILNVIGQSYKNIEYIIIDGGSKDKTLEIIKKYNSQIAKWISEPDKGLYDAMNKGIRLATGDYVWFMNSGDLFYEADTLKKIVENYTPNSEVYYGQTAIINVDNEITGMRHKTAPKVLTWKSLRMGMVVCHQAFMVKREICDLFDLQYKHAADIDWMIRVLKKSRRNVFTDMILCRFLSDGHSAKYRKHGLKERFNIQKKHYGLFTTIVFHGIIFIQNLFRRIF